MHGFHQYLRVLGISKIQDTQCGFKMFSRQACREIFANMHNEGWIFDVEILLLAEHKGIPVVEVPITWHEVPESKVQLMYDSIKMAVDLLTIRLAYLFGIYKWTEESHKAVRKAELKKDK